MKIVEPSFEIEWPEEHMVVDALDLIERAARTCYQTEPRSDRPWAVLRKCIERGHHSVLEHSQMTVRFICDRGVSHELVRHRLCAFSQESTRYCNYSKDRFENEVTFILPYFFTAQGKWNEETLWRASVVIAEEHYLALLEGGAKPEEARAVLPNSLKTEIVVTANFREWRHIFTLRTAKAAHPQMRQLMRPLLKAARELIPIVFDDVGVTDDN